jgi:hypothetical protein
MRMSLEEVFLKVTTKEEEGKDTNGTDSTPERGAAGAATGAVNG